MHSSGLIPVEGHGDLARDPITNAIINTNQNEYEQYVAERNKRLEQKNKIENTAEELKEVKQEISEIKELLLKLASNINT